MKVQGDFDKACQYAEDIENGVATQLSIFDFLPPEELLSHVLEYRIYA